MSRELSMEDVYPNIFIHIVEITGDKITTNINLQHVIIAGSNIILREHLAHLCIIQAFLSLLVLLKIIIEYPGILHVYCTLLLAISIPTDKQGCAIS